MITAVNGDLQIVMHDKTELYYKALLDYKAKNPFEICSAIVTLLERYCTQVTSQKLDTMRFTERFSGAMREYYNQKKLKTLLDVLDQYVDKKVKTSIIGVKIYEEEYQILDLSKIPQDIQQNIISASKQKSSIDKKLEKRTRNL